VPVLLRISDTLCRGDEFRVRDRGYTILATSDVATDRSCDDDPLRDGPAEAWFDPSLSKGRFLLQPGPHRVAIRVTNSPFGGGALRLRIDRRPLT
jgi:hypothetical protein